MNLLPALSSALSANTMRAQATVRGIGNANSSRTLDGECEQEEQFRRNERGDRRAAPVSQTGTGNYVPFWNGPRLRPSFVAQVLGQVLMDSQSQALPAAYRGASAQIAQGAFFNDEV